MNMAVTHGLSLMPAAFAAGLSVWSPGDGTAGSASYAGASNAALVSGDADFGHCLELVKTTGTQRLRYMGVTPFRTGMYLRVTARVKVLSGSMPSVRVSCLPLGAAGALSGLVQAGPARLLSSYGAVVTVSAILGSGARPGVDLAWGTAPTGAHLGIEFTGANGATLRVENLVVEDVTSVFHRQMLPLTDVMDYGAKGDGSTNDLAAFQAADAAALAAGRVLLIPEGVYALGGNLSLASPVRFEGRVAMASEHRLALTRNFDIDAYTAAFGSEEEGLRRGLQAIFHFSDHVSFDLKGRSVSLTAPLFVAENAGLQGASYAQRRVLDNGQLSAVAGEAWTPGSVTSQASYSTAAPYTLSGVTNIANIEIGSLVTGTGVARETYVRSKNVAAGTLELSLPPGSQGGTRTYGFTRFRYMLDFSGFGRLDRFEMADLEFLCGGHASAVMLPPSGITTRFQGCVFNRPRNRAITSIGTGCQGMMVDECQFLSDEQALKVQDRSTVAFNINANDVKIRDNRAVRFRHFGVLHGTGHLFVGNHWFQGDSEAPGVRSAGLVLTGINVKTLITGNYIDNSFIEMTNEREPDPDFVSQFSFGGLTVTGNIFTANNVVSAFCWLVVTPRGAGHYLHGISITGNTFRTLNGAIARVEKVDTTWSDLDYSRFRNLTVHGNNFNGVTTAFQNPLTLRHVQNAEAPVWTVNSLGLLPFGGRARVVSAVVADGAITQGAVTRYEMPATQNLQGGDQASVNLRWPVSCKGAAWVTLRADSPT